MNKVPRGKTFPQDTKEAIVRGHQLGRSAKDLAYQFDCSSWTIYSILRRFKIQGDVSVKKQPGRPKKTSHVMDRNIVRCLIEDPKRTSTDIQKLVDGPYEPSPSQRTIRRRLQQKRLNRRRPVKKPFINEKKRKARVK